jgi:hypothetical protein
MGPGCGLQYYRFDEPRRWINSGGLGTMGVGLPYAMGIKLAKPDQVFCITGEGSIQMNIQETAGHLPAVQHAGGHLRAEQPLPGHGAPVAGDRRILRSQPQLHVRCPTS